MEGEVSGLLRLLKIKHLVSVDAVGVTDNVELDGKKHDDPDGEGNGTADDKALNNSNETGVEEVEEDDDKGEEPEAAKVPPDVSEATGRTVELNNDRGCGLARLGLGLGVDRGLEFGCDRSGSAGGGGGVDGVIPIQ